MNNNNPFGDNLVKLIAVFIAIGAPAAGTFAFSVTQNPRQAIGVAVLWTIATVAVGFVVKVWQRLEEPLVEDTASWIRQGIRDLFARYPKRDRQHLIYTHRAFDVKGLTTQGIYTLELGHSII